MAWLRHAGREGTALEGISPALRAGASDFGKTQSHQKSFPPANRPLRGFPRLVQRVGRLVADGTLAYAIPGFGQSPLRTSLFSRQIGVEQCSPRSDLAPMQAAAAPSSLMALMTR